MIPRGETLSEGGSNTQLAEAIAEYKAFKITQELAITNDLSAQQAIPPETYTIDARIPGPRGKDLTVGQASALMVWAEQNPDAEWWQRAKCKSPDGETLYPERAVGLKAARTICAACVVRNECLGYALANQEDQGVWGGTSERERRKILKTLAFREPISTR